MTLLWFVIWIIADNWGDREPLLFDPVNFWVGALILAIAIVTVLGPGLVNAVVAVVIVSIPLYARLTRSAVLTTRESDYVTASRALG